jgi:hypothetical protein
MESRASEDNLSGTMQPTLQARPFHAITDASAWSVTDFEFQDARLDNILIADETFSVDKSIRLHPKPFRGSGN